MLSWSILRAYCVLTAVTAQAISADIINEQQLIVHENKQLLSYQQLAQTAGIRGRRTATSYTQPMHRSILSAKRRRESSQLREDSSRRMPDFNIINEDEPSYQMHNESLLTTPYWVKIHEEYGDNSFNFIPSSRRAASSVAYTYKYHVNNDGMSRVLQKNTTSAVSSASVQVKGTNSTTATNMLKHATSDVSSNDVTHNSSSASSNNTRPESKTINSTANNAQIGEEEYMIISGGYTDRDWETFPVYAFPLTSSIQSLSGQWIDLSPPDINNIACNQENTDAYQSRLFEEAQFLNENNTIQDPWDKAENCGPTGRMGHISVVHNDKLYVFGGLIYDEEQAASGGFNRKRETFRLEDVPYIYRLDLKEMFKAREAESKGSSVKQVTGWQRIIPRIKPFSTNDIDSTSSASAAEVLIASINRGEMQGGLWSSDSPEEHDKMIMYGGLRIAKFYSGPSKFVKGGSTFGSPSQMRSHKTIEVPLGDVWGYDLVDNAWEKITNSFGKGVDSDNSNQHTNDEEKDIETDPSNLENDDDWYTDLGKTSYPRPRTAHASTVVGDNLIIHSGMGWNERTNDWDGSTEWEMLDDMWIFNLKSRKWKRRYVYPLLVRSYHSLVGWDVDTDNMMEWGKDLKNYTSWEGPVVAIFGGYTTDINVFSGEQIAYVFDDLLISYPPPVNDEYDSPSLWLKASNTTQYGSDSISTRYEHAAVLSKEGVLTVWGGSFQETSAIKGVWMIGIAGKDSNINLSMAEGDSLYDDYEQTVMALHTMVIMLMFMSLSLTFLLGLTQRYQELVQQANSEGAELAGFPPEDLTTNTPQHRRGGLHQEIIDTIPRKQYSASDSETGEEEPCPICLAEYEEGDELRVLPCNHYMHTRCLDEWLSTRPSCPTCRYSLSELVDDRPMMQLRTLRSRLARSILTGNELGSVEMIDVLSSLALSEEGDRVENLQNNSTNLPPHTAMSELSDWRRRRQELRNARRRSGLQSLRNISRIRHNRERRTRIPQVDMDEPVD